MPTPLRIVGTVASPGYAAGPVYRLEREAAAYDPSGNPETEAARLASAIAVASEQITGLMESADEDSAAILEFQVAMLEDESLAEPVLDAIAQGTDAASAWRTALDVQVAEYEAAEDTYFRARSADLADIRNRVLDALGGAVNGKIPAGSVLVGGDISPTAFLSADWSKGGGIVLEAGSARGHVAMLARARGVPMLVSTGTVNAAKGDRVLLDAEHGGVIVTPAAADDDAFAAAQTAWASRRAAAEGGLKQPAVTRDGVTISMMVNIAEPADVTHLSLIHI